MVHIRKEKGDLATAMCIADLTEKGYKVFTPVVTEHLPFDLIAYKDGVSKRIQAKYSADGIVQNKTVWSDANGSHTRKYAPDDFDYYAIYLPTLRRVIYPSISFGGCKIALTVPNAATKFWWWEDFTHLTDTASKRHYRQFGLEVTHTKTSGTIEASIKRRKVTRPSKEELEKLLWKKPTSQLAIDFGVSDKAIEKWAKSYGILKPPRGYWSTRRLDRLPCKRPTV